MNANVFDRRRAERFAQLLDEAGGGRRHHTRDRADEGLPELIAVTDRLIAVKPRVELDPEFRSGLRAMLVAQAERDQIGATAVEAPAPASLASESRPKSTGRRIRARSAVIIGVAVGAIAVSGMSAASEDAMPGDALYGVKRSTERAQLALASSDVTRGQLLLDFARTRRAEASGVRGAAEFSSLLDDMDGDTREGAKLLHSAAVERRDPAPLDAVDTFVSGQREQITKMLDRLPNASHDRAVTSLAVLDQVSQRSKGLRALLDCGDGATTVGTDALGPKPGVCRSAPALGRPDRSGGTGASQLGGSNPTPERTQSADSTSAGNTGASAPVRGGSGASDQAGKPPVERGRGLSRRPVTPTR